MMSKEALLRLLDATFLSSIFLFQSVILNFYIIRHFRTSSSSFFFFLLDFFCLLIFSFTLFLAFRNKHKLKRKAERSLNSSICSNNSINSARPNSCNSNDSGRALYSSGHCFSQISSLPFIYISWIFYTFVLILKIVVLFKADVPQSITEENGFFGVQMLKLAIGVSAFILTLLVEAHHDCDEDDLRRNYVRFCSSSLALEIFDTTSFLAILIPSETHLIYPYSLENFILVLSSLNLLLPAIALYKLSISGFGKNYNIPIEFLYKVLHLLCVNIPYMGFRIYLWSFWNTDVSVFLIKNIYATMSFIREFIPEIKKLRKYYIERSRQRPKVIANEELHIEAPASDEKVFKIQQDENIRMNIL